MSDTECSDVELPSDPLTQALLEIRAAEIQRREEAEQESLAEPVQPVEPSQQQKPYYDPMSGWDSWDACLSPTTEHDQSNPEPKEPTTEHDQSKSSHLDGINLFDNDPEVQKWLSDLEECTQENVFSPAQCFFVKCCMQRNLLQFAEQDRQGVARKDHIFDVNKMVQHRA